MIDYLDLLGVPFQYGGRGPKELDCYGLVMELHRRQGVELPDFRSPEILVEIESLFAHEKYRWRCHAKREGNALIPYTALLPGRVIEIMIKGHACHVGMIHKPRRFLHTWKGTGGVTEERLELWRPRILGVYEFGN